MHRYTKLFMHHCRPLIFRLALIFPVGWVSSNADIICPCLSFEANNHGSYSFFNYHQSFLSLRSSDVNHNKLSVYSGSRRSKSHSFVEENEGFCLQRRRDEELNIPRGEYMHAMCSRWHMSSALWSVPGLWYAMNDFNNIRTTWIGL